MRKRIFARRDRLKMYDLATKIWESNGGVNGDINKMKAKFRDEAVTYGIDPATIIFWIKFAVWVWELFNKRKEAIKAMPSSFYSLKLDD